MLQSRGAAARAKEELNGVLLHQQELKLGWGKAVSMPSTPLFAGTATAHAPVKGERLRRLSQTVLLEPCGSWGWFKHAEAASDSAASCAPRMRLQLGSIGRCGEA
jgi:hypothetical protein